MESITVVICSYTEARWPTLRAAIDGVLKQTGLNDELLVVVDHNERLLARCNDYVDGCTVIPNRHERGLSGARNTGLEEAHGSVVAFLDDDAIPLDGWLDELRGPYADGRIWGVGGLVKPSWEGVKPSWFPDEFLWVVGCSYLGLPATSHPVRNFIGANMSFRKKAFASAGTFTETMGRINNRPLGCEETEFCIRLTRANPEVVLLYHPPAQVEHYVPKQRASFRYFVTRCWAEGLSKAEVSRRGGRSSGLSVERDYTSRVLPKGMLKGLRNSITGDISGTGRSAAIVLGLVCTASGFLAGSLRRSSSVRSRAAA